jgi:3-oxoacyl-[acyl-carrier-protein] synthase III
MGKGKLEGQPVVRSYIGGISFRLGRNGCIEDLFAEPSAGDGDIDFFRTRGLRNYFEQVEPLGTMCTSVVDESLRKCSVDAEQLGAVVVDAEQWHCTSEDRIQLLESLDACGISGVPVIGLDLQTCSGCLTALSVADRLHRTDRDRKPVLVLLCGRAAPGTSRVDFRRATILSDGVASCVVSSTPGSFALLASTTHTNLRMVRSGVAGEKAVVSVVRSHADLAAVANRLYALAEIHASQIDALLCTNGNLLYVTFAGRAAGVAEARIYTENVAAYGHVFSCDHLINLATYASFKPFLAGGKYLLIGWSPYVFGGAVVSYEGASG